jgi:hypothetical protein
MNQIKVWPHMTIVAILVAVLAGLGVALYMRHEQTAAAQELPYEARIQRVDGDVAFSENLPNVDPNSNEQWTAATANQPFSVGDRIYTRDQSRASLAFSGRNFARLNPNTSLDVIALEDSRTQLALREGSAIFDVGYLAPGELFEVGTPYGAIDFNEPGLYNVGFDDNGSVLVSALSGVAQVVGLAGSGQISKGELLTLVGQTAAQVALSRLNGNDASYLVDDYYRYQYPNTYDGRYYDNYDAYLSDPYYYDPYRRDVSYQYVNYDIPGVNDLSYYGDWQNYDGYGYAWSPRVDAGWAPYQDGYWVNDYPYGLTWVSSEPWGYAPYHYGRWANAGGRWVWVPDSVNTAPVYSPALVAFLPHDDQIGWVPLGPGDPYAPRYYDANWQPRYLTRVNTVPVQLVNLGVPEAVTVVPLDAFGRNIDRRNIRRFDRNVLASVRPTLDPLTLTPLRNAVVHSAWGRGKKDLPPGIAKKLNETPVFVGDSPRSRFGRDVARAMRVERVPDQARNQKFQVRDERNIGRDNAAAMSEQQARQAFEQQNRQRQQQIDSLKSEAARGNRQAERQARQLEQQNRQAQQQQARQLEQQKQQSRQAEQQRRNEARVQAEAARAAERAQRGAAQQPQGQRVGNPRKIQPQTEPHRPPLGNPQPEKQRPQAQPRSQPRYQLPPRQEVRREQPRPQAQPRPQPMPRQERSQPRQQVERPQPQPRQQVQQQPRPQQQSQGAAKQQERQQQPAAQPAGQAKGGGKGKGKKP